MFTGTGYYKEKIQIKFGQGKKQMGQVPGEIANAELPLFSNVESEHISLEISVC